MDYKQEYETTLECRCAQRGDLSRFLKVSDMTDWFWFMMVEKIEYMINCVESIPEINDKYKGDLHYDWKEIIHQICSPSDKEVKGLDKWWNTRPNATNRSAETRFWLHKYMSQSRPDASMSQAHFDYNDYEEDVAEFERWIFSRDGVGRYLGNGMNKKTPKYFKRLKIQLHSIFITTCAIYGFDGVSDNQWALSVKAIKKDNEETEETFGVKKAIEGRIYDGTGIEALLKYYSNETVWRRPCPEHVNSKNIKSYEKLLFNFQQKRINKKAVNIIEEHVLKAIWNPHCALGYKHGEALYDENFEARCEVCDDYMSDVEEQDFNEGCNSICSKC